MSQNDFVIANQTTPLFRADLNSALQALASNSSGSTAPTTTYANMFWYDTGTNIIKMRSEADDAWINVAYVDQSDNAWRVLNNTQVVNTSGTQTGLLGSQTTATWEVGSSTTESLVSPAKVKAAVKPALNATGSAPVYACRAWVNFNGTGTVAIRASGNVSSITDNGTGDYTVNFTTAMPDADYSCVLQTTGLAAADGRRHAFVHGSQAGGATTKTASALRINTGATQTNSTSDMANISVSIFR